MIKWYCVEIDVAIDQVEWNVDLGSIHWARDSISVVNRIDQTPYIESSQFKNLFRFYGSNPIYLSWLIETNKPFSVKASFDQWFLIGRLLTYII